MAPEPGTFRAPRGEACWSTLGLAAADASKHAKFDEKDIGALKVGGDTAKLRRLPDSEAAATEMALITRAFGVARHPGHSE